VFPAQQRLEGVDLIRFKNDERLVVQFKLFAGERLAKVISSSRRTFMRVFISGSKNRKVPRPSALAS
jgi:hypothetical protein